MEDSVFTKIIKGEIHQEIIYQDDLCFVILTIEPLNPGHMLVIPRKQIDHLWDTPPELYQHLMLITKQMAHLVRKTYDYKRVGLIVEGFGVPHAHVHVFGLNEGMDRTVMQFAATRHASQPADLKIEADKLRANL